MTDLILRAQTRAVLTQRSLRTRLAEDRGDVPGWVLITLMTAALVMGLWAIAGPRLQEMFETSLSGVTGPDDPR